MEHFAAHVDGDFARQVTIGNGSCDLSDVANLARQISGHEVDVVSQVFPCAGHAGHIGLAAELAFGSHFARHARHFTGECVELIDHRIDSVFKLENLALHIDSDLAAQVAASDGGSDFSNIAHLRRQVAGHRVY